MGAERNTVAERPARRRRRTPAEIMERLLAAATAEFTAFGYSGATTAAIARRGDVTEAQLFRYFPSKAELFREAIFEPLSRHIGRFHQGAFKAARLADEGAGTGEGAGEDEDRARAYIAELTAFLRDHAGMLMSLLVARAYEGEAHPAAGMNSLDRYFDRGAAILSRRLGRSSTVAPELMVRVSFAALLACVMLDDWLFPDGLAPRGEIDAAIATFIVNGISLGSGGGAGE